MQLKLSPSLRAPKSAPPKVWTGSCGKWKNAACLDLTTVLTSFDSTRFWRRGFIGESKIVRAAVYSIKFPVFWTISRPSVGLLISDWLTAESPPSDWLKPATVNRGQKHCKKINKNTGLCSFGGGAHKKCLYFILNINYLVFGWRGSADSHAAPPLPLASLPLPRKRRIS